MTRLSPAAHKKSFVCEEVRPAAILDARAGGPQRGRSRGCGYRPDAPTPRLGTDARLMGRGHLSAAKLKEQLACDTGPDGAGLARGSEFLRFLPGATVRAELGKARPGPRCRVLPGTGGMGKSRWRRRGVVGGRQKLDPLSSLQMRGDKERLAQQSPPAPRPALSRGCPLGDPRARLPGGRNSGKGRRSSLTSGLKLLPWAQPREASVVPSVSRGSRRLREGRGAGDMVRGVGAPGGAGSAAGPTPWGRAAALLGRLCLLKERNVDS